MFETADSSLGHGTFVSWHVPAALGDVILVEACGSDSSTREEITERGRRADDAVAAINEVAAADPFEPSRFVLQADRRHRLTVTWNWTGRRIPDPAGTAEADRVDCDGLETEGTTVTQEFTFRTAPDYRPLPVPVGSGPPSEPDADAADVEYTSFDVRDLKHYLKSVPSFDAPPMFTDDLVHVEYHVDHLTDLLSRYDRTLELAVIRADSRIWCRYDTRTHAAHRHPRFLGRRAVLGTCCTVMYRHPPGARGGGELLAYDLEPNARYDLLITGPARGGGESLDRHLIERAPFRTSRYSSPAGLFAEAGWAPASAPLSYLPNDLIVAADASLTGVFAPASDVGFEAALTALGVDIEQAERPQTTILWKPPMPSAPPRRPSLRDGLDTLGLIDSRRLNVKRLVELLRTRSRREPGLPVFPGRTRPPVRDPRLLDLRDGAGRDSLRPSRHPGSRYGLEWFHVLLAENGLAEGGDAVEALGKRLTLAFTDRRSGGVPRAVELLRSLVKELLVPPPRAPQQGWRVAGVLVESLESIIRPGEVELDAIAVGAETLPLRASNSAQSRLLFVPDSAIELRPGMDSPVALRYRHRRIAGVDSAGQIVHSETSVDVAHRVGRRPQSIEWEV